MVDNNSIIEGAVKFRDGKKWKTRWCVMTKISPVADCLHLQLYRDCKDRYKQGQTKASLSLQHFLGLESGFTLDKESNTVAIICQDLTVVLAFDTRERLIQWQVKIGTHLGEDQQFLIQISTAPAKSKVATGPARLHVQDHKFCLTTGVPPRLLGVWEIGHLRRYGVVDGKFCFEGGSRCGPRAEGLHVLGCGQASEVHQAMQLAAQGRLATRRRPISRKMSAMDSPRKTMHSRAETRASDLSCADSLLSGDILSRSLCEGAQGSATMEDLSGRRSPWGSAESQNTDLMDSCSDATSVVAADLDMERRGAMERCASCISKLGNMSVKGATFSPAWTMEQHSQSACLGQPADRASLSSGSSGGSSATDWYDRPRAVQPAPSVPPKSPRHAVAPVAPRCQCCPPERPPKPPSPRKAAPPPCHRAVPGHAQPLSQAEEHNYDVPRSFLHARVPVRLQERHSSLDYYDTPKKIREALTAEYSNYDTPPIAKSVRQPCGCVLQMARRTDEAPQQSQTLRRDPAGGQFSNSCCPSRQDEFSGVHVNKRPLQASCGHLHMNEGNTQSPKNVNTQYTRVELEDGRQYFRKEAPLSHCVRGTEENNSGHHFTSNNSQFMRKEGEDCSGLQYVWKDAHNKSQFKKNVGVGCGLQMARMATEAAGCPCQRVMCWSELLPCRRGSGAEDTGIPIHKVRLNGEGRMPVRDPSGQLSVLYATVDKSKKKPRPPPSPNYVNIGEPQQQHANYANMDFAQSLENYENAKDILQRAGISKDDIDNEEHDHLCQKCGHAPEHYLVMEPRERKPFPGYLAMGPAASLGRASSIPALASRHPHLNDTLSSTTSLHHSPGMSDLRHHALQRKRSSSADAARFLSDDEEVPVVDTEALTETENSQERLSITQEETATTESTDSTISDYTQINPTNNTDSDVSVKDISIETDSVELKERLMTLPRSNIDDLKEKPVAVHIRRSSSVPCKTGHNRDSSSSNDSGVSAGSPHFPDLEPRPACLHSSLPRRCKSSDPLKDIRTRTNVGPAKSSSAEAEVPINLQPSKGIINSRASISHSGGYSGPNGENSTPAPYPDSHSTSSGTSDMSDYIETLSLSSHSSSDIPDSLRLIGRPATTTLRPRSGREYQKIDRAFIETDLKGTVTDKSSETGMRGLAQYPGIDKCESPSPGYMSGSPGQERDMQDNQPH